MYFKITKCKGSPQKTRLQMLKVSDLSLGGKYTVCFSWTLSCVHYKTAAQMIDNLTI